MEMDTLEEMARQRELKEKNRTHWNDPKLVDTFLFS